MNIQQIKELKELLGEISGLHQQKEALRNVTAVQFQGIGKTTLMTIKGPGVEMYEKVAAKIIDARIENLTTTAKDMYGIDLNN